MTKQDKQWLYIIIFVAVAFILWLLLHGNNAVAQVIKQNVPWLETIASPSPGGGITVDESGYVPATMPGLSSSKCDSNSPCTFCIVPNATYPSTPHTSVGEPTYSTANITAPVTFGQSSGAMPVSAINANAGGTWLGSTFQGFTSGGWG